MDKLSQQEDKRIDKAPEQIAEGKSRNGKYEQLKRRS
jgi:hypothetical protein